MPRKKRRNGRTRSLASKPTCPRPQGPSLDREPPEPLPRQSTPAPMSFFANFQPHQGPIMLLESPLCGRCHVLWAHRQPPCSAQSDAFQLQKVPQEGSTTAFVPTKQFPTAPHKCCILEPTLDRKKRPQSSSEAPNRSKYGLACTRRGANGLGLKSAAVPHLAKTQLDTLPSPPSRGLPTRLGGPGT